MSYIQYIDIYMKETLIQIFEELNERIEAENEEREDSGAAKLCAIEVHILGQMSLLANEVTARILPLQRTGDLDAVIKGTQGFISAL
jgi:hypothetical protein